MKLDIYHVLTAQQFERQDLEYLYRLINVIRRFDKNKEKLIYLSHLLGEKRALLYFTQPSTRTFLSFHSACQILGIKCLEIRDPNTSSEYKGESKEDSIRTFSSYVDLLIMRTEEAKFCDKMAKTLDLGQRSVPLINAGSGPDEHPTQALLDIYTLMRSFKDSGGLDGKTICMVGDLKRGRTIRSLSLLLRNFKDIHIIFSSPKAFAIEDDLRQQLKKCPHLTFTETQEFEKIIPEVDSIYMTRMQREYDSLKEKLLKPHNYQKYHLKFQHLDKIKPDCVIMHPLPRTEELDSRIDSDPRAKYWRQERNGMWLRVALIASIFKVDAQIFLPEFED